MGKARVTRALRCAIGSFVRHDNPLVGDFDAHAVQAAQKGNEGGIVVGRKDPTDLLSPQFGSSDFDRFRRIPIEFACHTLERFIFEHDLPA